MTHFAKVGGFLERLVADAAVQRGETDNKKLAQLRHRFRDAARPLYWRHEHTGAAYISDLVNLVKIHIDRVEHIYTHTHNPTPLESYQDRVRSEGSPSKVVPRGYDL